MDKNIYFREWVHNWTWGARAALFLILLFSILQFSLFSLTQNYVVSYFGAQPEDITFSIQVTYVSLLFCLPIQIRFLNYFNTKRYLIVVLLAGIILNLLCMHTTDITLFTVLRFFQGMVIGLMAGAMLTLIFTRLHEEKKQAVGYSVFYGTLLGSSVAVGAPSAWIIDNMDWKMIYYIVIVLQVISIAIVYLIFNKERVHRKYPLTQIDWKAYIVLATGMLCVAYCMVYGPKEYWFESRYITYVCMLAFALLYLFIYRQVKSKRPIIHFSIFGSTKFVTGLLLLALFYGFKDTINLVYSYISTVTQWSNYQYIELAFFNIAGLAFSMYLSSAMVMRKKHSIRVFLVAGFGIMLAFNIWMYFIISTDLSFIDLVIPIFLQGAASGMLFVPIATYILSTVPVNTGLSGSLVAGHVRLFATLNSFAGYYTLQLFYNQHYKEQFLAHLTPYDTTYTDANSAAVQSYVSKGFTQQEAIALAHSSIMKQLTTQAQLLTSQTIFLIVATAISVIIVLVLTWPLTQKVYQKYISGKITSKKTTSQQPQIQAHNNYF
ncbi:MFS transporter [Flavobacterium sp. Sd200]|uniref:MFS transporter n=1 Tax=Flavobacterium sp. Sd200 TaxID=2692211 RepID=UPI001368066F|nr:MFS transporter [Flavobacterium sp. Sd200]MXN90230.1 MFS transporter [Flavobacterium sp. Sd200]